MILDGKEIRYIFIGASAGGVTAINTFLKMVRPLEVPVMVTLHTPQHSEFVSEAFRPFDPEVEVKEAEDKESSVGKTFYFAPSDYHLLIEQDGTLSLSSEDQVNFARPSIDVMFESAASSLGESSLGILLTGANHDGAMGLKAIHDAGGMTWVQAPEEASSPEMPESALALFKPNRTIFLAQMVELLNGQ